MAYAEIKAYRDIGAKGLYNGESAAKLSRNRLKVQRLSSYNYNSVEEHLSEMKI